MLGNLLIVIILVFYGCLANLLLKPKPGGDYGVGYSFAWMIYVAGYLIFTGLLAWNMNWNDCFDWVPASLLHYLNWLVFFGWIAFVLASIWSLDYHSKWIEGEFFQYMRWLARSKVYIWLPLAVLIPCIYLVNAPRSSSFPPSWVKYLIQTGFLVSTVIALGIFWAFLKLWVRRRIKTFQVRIGWLKNLRSSYNASFEYINNYKEATIDGLLKFANPNNDRQPRNAATAKIKSFEHWEQDLIEILTKKNLEKIYVYNDDTYYVYAFLDGNKIEHPEKFIQPILYSLSVLEIRLNKDLNDAYALELGRFNLDTVCRVLETQFKDKSAEFRPSMLKLQTALAIMAPERMNKTHRKSYEKTLKKYRLAINNWLDSN